MRCCRRHRSAAASPHGSSPLRRDSLLDVERVKSLVPVLLAWCLLLSSILPPLLLAGCSARGKEAAEASKPTIEVEYRILEPLDLMLHVYAHIDMGENAATNHDPAYVERIREAKSTYLDSMENLEKELAAVSAMARENMRLVYLQWVGIYAESPESLVMSLRCISGEQSDRSSLSPSERGVISGLSGMLELTPGEKEVIAQLAGIISREHETFYHAYHAARMSEFEKQRDSLEEFMNKDGLPAVRPFFARGGITKFVVIATGGITAGGITTGGIATGGKATVWQSLPEERGVIREIRYSGQRRFPHRSSVGV